MPDDGEGSLRMTYAQLAEARGITRRSAERLARARKWPRMRGNDGVAVVFVPPGGEQGCQQVGRQGRRQGGRQGRQPKPVAEPVSILSVTPADREVDREVDREAIREAVRDALREVLREAIEPIILDLQQRLSASEEDRRRLTELLAAKPNRFRIWGWWR